MLGEGVGVCKPWMSEDCWDSVCLQWIPCVWWPPMSVVHCPHREIVGCHLGIKLGLQYLPYGGFRGLLAGQHLLIVNCGSSHGLSCEESKTFCHICSCHSSDDCLLGLAWWSFWCRRCRCGCIGCVRCGVCPFLCVSNHKHGFILGFPLKEVLGATRAARYMFLPGRTLTVSLVVL